MLFKTDKLSYERMQNYHISVIEKEVTEGMLKVENTKGSCLAFLRKINNLNMADNRGGRH